MAEHASPTRTGIRRFNEIESATLRPQLHACLGDREWVAAILAARPYAGFEALLARSDRAAAALDEARVRAAIRDHPRIGMLAEPGSPGAGWSASEQSGVDSSDTGLAERLRAANAEYERRFGHIYLVCATGRDGESILADLHGRLANDPVRELRVVREELAAIARLRLRKVVDG